MSRPAVRSLLKMICTMRGNLKTGRPGDRIVRIELDGLSLAPATADIEHERKVAVHDILEENTFRPRDSAEGPFELHLSGIERRLVFDIRYEGGNACLQIHLSMTPFRKIIKDYFLVCESYYDAIRHAPPEKIETVDMARRALHDEGSDILCSRLGDKVELDMQTARRLFTLVCSLHMR